MLNQAERADALHICSFAMAEGFARRLLKQRERIGQLYIYLDFTVADRNRANALFIRSIADEVYLCNTHAKLLLVESQTCSSLAVLSANATMNHRYESGIQSTSPDLIRTAKQELEKMKTNSVRL